MASYLHLRVVVALGMLRRPHRHGIVGQAANLTRVMQHLVTGGAAVFVAILAGGAFVFMKPTIADAAVTPFAHVGAEVIACFVCPDHEKSITQNLHSFRAI